MAKKVVATLKKKGGVEYVKVIKTVKSKKTGAYSFKEALLPSDLVKDFLNKK